jgi:hypothetical protein
MNKSTVVGLLLGLVAPCLSHAAPWDSLLEGYTQQPFKRNQDYTIQCTVRGADVDDRFKLSNGVMTYQLKKGDKSTNKHEPRVELRNDDEWSRSGSHQFDADVKVDSKDAHVNILQIKGNFDSSKGKSSTNINVFFSLSVQDGKLKTGGDNIGDDLISFVPGKWYHINVIHDQKRIYARVYDGNTLLKSWSTTQNAAPISETRYWKCGAYHAKGDKNGAGVVAEDTLVSYRNVKILKK